MSEAPERIWAVNFVEKSNERDAQGKYWHNPVNAGAEYVRADLYEQVKREWDGLKAENRKLRNLISATHKNPVKHENCRRHYCPICEGGLFQCADCGAVEIETEERVCTAAERLAGARVVTDAMVAAFQDKYREFWKGSWPDTETSRELLRAALAEPAGEFDKILSDSSEFVASLSDSMRATGRSVFNPPKPAGEVEKDEIPIAADENREVDWVDVTGWGVFKGHAIPVEVARYIATKINLYAKHRATPPDASAIRDALDIPECVLSLCADKITMAFETSEDATCAFDAIDAALAGAKP